METNPWKGHYVTGILGKEAMAPNLGCVRFPDFMYIFFVATTLQGRHHCWKDLAKDESICKSQEIDHLTTRRSLTPWFSCLSFRCSLLLSVLEFEKTESKRVFIIPLVKKISAK